MEEKFIEIKAKNVDVAVVIAPACIAKVNAFIFNADIDKFFS